MIRNGHNWREIENYTVDQVRLFLDKIEQLDRKDHLGNISDICASVWGGDSGKARIEDLQK